MTEPYTPTVNSTVDEALDYLDSVYEGMPYDTYLTLHDLIGSLTPEPTVKPDREAEFKTYLSCIEEEEPEIQRLAKYDKHTLRTIFNAGFDVAVAEGRTERAVAEAAWQEAFAAARAWRLGSDPIPENPYRAKGAGDE